MNESIINSINGAKKIAILYNMGTNIFLGEISYITKAISAVLQLGVTMDFAIFLYHSYMQEKEKVGDAIKAMETAIAKTLTSVLGSSLTTIAGFLALCSMNLTLGKDIGIVMAKGVLFGVICVVTILPAMILQANSLIEKTKHREIMPKFQKLKEFNIKHYKAIIITFIIILPIAFFGSSGPLLSRYWETNAFVPLTPTSSASLKITCNLVLLNFSLLSLK